MADEVDSGNETAETFLKVALLKRSNEIVPEFTGLCHNCNRVVEPHRRWCDAVCRDEWQEFNDD